MSLRLYRRYYKSLQRKVLDPDPMVQNRAHGIAILVSLPFYVFAILSANLIFGVLLGFPALLGLQLSRLWNPIAIPMALMTAIQRNISLETFAFTLSPCVLGAGMFVFIAVYIHTRVFTRWSFDDRGLPNHLGTAHLAYPEEIADDQICGLLPKDYDIYHGYGGRTKAKGPFAWFERRRNRRRARAQLRFFQEQTIDLKATRPIREFDSNDDDLDPIVRTKPVIVTTKRALAPDCDPEFLRVNANFYAERKAEDPGFLTGTWLNPYRGGEEVYLNDRSDRFVMVMMPTRSGKGVSFVIPNLLSWTHSMFCNDPKSENAAATAWWRKYGLGNRIFIVSPMATDGRNARHNMLDEIRLGTVYEINDTYAISTSAMDSQGEGYSGEKGVWKARARDLVNGGILHNLLSDQYQEKSLRAVASFFNGSGRNLEDCYREMLTANHDPQGKYGWISPLTGRPTKTHPIVMMAAASQLRRPEGESGSVKSELETNLSWCTTQIGENSSTSDFSIADLMHGPVPSTVYLCVSPSDLPSAWPYLRLFLNAMILRNVGPLAFNEKGRPIKPYDWKLAMIIDELTTTFGNIEFYPRLLGIIAGYGLKQGIVVQDRSQLKETYGHFGLESNAHTQIFGATLNDETKNVLSQRMGKASAHRSAGRGKDHRADQYSFDLFTPDEIDQLHPDEQLIKMGHMPPIMSRKLRYYAEDSVFHERVRHADFGSDVIPPERRAGYAQMEEMRRENDALARERLARSSATVGMTSKNREVYARLEQAVRENAGRLRTSPNGMEDYEIATVEEIGRTQSSADLVALENRQLA